jgi:hypothetical protein
VYKFNKSSNLNNKSNGQKCPKTFSIITVLLTHV